MTAPDFKTRIADIASMKSGQTAILSDRKTSIAVRELDRRNIRGFQKFYQASDAGSPATFA